MKSGIVYSSAAAIDGLIDRLSEEVDGDVTVVATGGSGGKNHSSLQKKDYSRR